MNESNEPRVDAGLEEVLGGVSPPDMEAAILQRIARGERVELSSSRSARPAWSRFAAAALLLCATGVAVAIGVLQAQSRPGITIRCIDADQAPVAGAIVHVYQRQPDPDGNSFYREFGPYETDAKGQANCPTALTYGGSRFDRFVHAYVPGALVGCTRTLAIDDVDAATDVEVALSASRTVAGRITSPDGAPVPTAVVRVWSFHGPEGMHTSLPRNPTFPGIDSALSDLYEARLDNDGRFELHGLPEGGRIHLTADSPGLAQAQWSNLGVPPGPIPDLLELEMQAEALVRGTVVDRNGAPLGNAVVKLRVSHASYGVYIHDWKETRTDARGRFQLDALPESEVEVLAEAERLTMQPAGLSIRSGRATETTLTLTPAVTVRGRVVVADTGEPVVGAGVSAIAANLQQTPLGHDRSAADGSFQLHVPSGQIQIYFSRVPAGFAQPKPQIVEQLDLDGSSPEPLTLRLERTR